MKAKEVTCYWCGKKESMTLKPYKRKILFRSFFATGKRNPLCEECTKEASKEGKIPCVNRNYHHIGTVCEVCGLDG